MKFKTFRCIALLVVVFGIVGFGYFVKDLPSSPPAPLATNYRSQPQPVVVYNPPPAPVPVVAYTPPPQPAPVVAYVPPAPPIAQPARGTGLVFTTDYLKTKLGEWLVVNQYRHGKKQWVDILPNESFRATAIRFPEADAVKFSNNPGQWSQFRIDLNRDGVDDEKWLLKNGGLYKREVLGADGKTVVGQPEWFK